MFLTWEVAFLSIGSTRVDMWMWAAWNSEESAIEFFTTLALVLISWVCEMTIPLNKVALVRAMLLLVSASPAMAADLVLDTDMRTALATEALLATPDPATIQLPIDVTCHRTMTYRTLPLRAHARFLWAVFRQAGPPMPHI